MSGVHGLGLGPAARDWPKLTLAELAPVFAAYPGLGAPLAVLFHSPRPFAASALIQAEGAEVFVKRHDPRVRSPAWLAEEHAFIAHLHARGAGVPQVRATGGGATSFEGADGVFELHARGQGEDTYRDALSWTPARSLTAAASLGRALARLHRASVGFDRPARAASLLVAGDAWLRAEDPLAWLQARLDTDPLLLASLQGRSWREDFQRVLLPWHAAAEPHAAAQPQLWAHGDLHASNTFWSGGQVSAVIDFGLCNRASAMFDLATALERNTIDWLHLAPDRGAIGQATLARALIAGYGGELPLTAGQARGLAHLLPLVHVDFALSELAYFHAITRAPDSAELAYTNFLLGHASWFATGAGAAYLAAVARAAASCAPR